MRFELISLLLVFGLAFTPISHGQQGEGDLVLIEMFHRHGSKIPDLIEPSTRPYWATWGYAGELTAQGILEMEALGEYVRRKYIVEEEFLSDEFDQNEVYVRASSYNPRPLQSASAALSALYPGAPVPVYTVDPEIEDLVATSLTRNCPSFAVEEPRLYREYDQYLEEQHEGLFRDLRELTEYDDDMTPSRLLSNLGDKFESEITHGYPMHPYFNENQHEFLPLVQGYYNMPLTRDDVDPRGDHYQKLGREVMENLRAASQGGGSSLERLHWYSSHGVIIAGIRSVLGLDMTARIDYGEAIIIELRRLQNGQFIARANLLRPYREGIVGRVTYQTTSIPLNCPGPQEVCPLDNLYAYLVGRLGPEDGCCVRGQGFFDIGCGDFLNPDTLAIPECKKWREVCPQTACGTGQVVDAETLNCVRVAML